MSQGNYLASLSKEEILALSHDIATLLRRINKGHLEVVMHDNGEYSFGDMGPFKVAQVRDRIMVRLPNTWDTLEHALLEYDKVRKVFSSDAAAERRNL